MKNYMEILEKYCSDIINGKITAGIWTKKAVKRFISDRKREKRDDFPFYFDEKRTEKCRAL